MSAITSGRFVPRVTHWHMKTISSSETATVDSRPWTTIPDESPTRIRATPAASASRRLGAAEAERFRSGGQRGWQGKGFLTLRRGESRVARAEREAVGIPHGRQDPELHFQVQVLDQTAEDQRLLRVLLAEVGAPGSDDVE